MHDPTSDPESPAPEGLPAPEGDRVPDGAEELGFEGVEFVENPEPRCPCVVLLDVSSDGLSSSLREVEEGLRALCRDLSTDELASKRVELAVVTYGPVRALTDFTTVEELEPPALEAGQDATLGEAVELALEMVEERKDLYRAHGIAHYRPWVLLLSSGRASDSWETAAELVREGEARGSFTFRTVALEGADHRVLDLLSERDVRQLQSLRFAELFSWLGQSLSAVSRSSVGGEVELPEPWAWALV